LLLIRLKLYSMNFEVNFKQLFANIRPYFLGGEKFVGILDALAKGLKTVNDKFNVFRNDTRFLLAFNMQIIYIEKYLNEVYPNPYLYPNNIHILDSSNVMYKYIYNFLENQSPDYVRNNSELAQPFYFRNNSEQISQDFIIKIPTYCQTSNDYIGQPFSEITLKKRVNFYNLGGKKYEIQYF
jgi:hypothetical protein